MIFWEGAEVYHEKLGMFGEVVGVDDDNVFVKFEDGSRSWFTEFDLMFRDTAECMLDLCDCDCIDVSWDELGVEGECGY